MCWHIPQISADLWHRGLWCFCYLREVQRIQQAQEVQSHPCHPERRRRGSKKKSVGCSGCRAEWQNNSTVFPLDSNSNTDNKTITSDFCCTTGKLLLKNVTRDNINLYMVQAAIMESLSNLSFFFPWQRQQHPTFGWTDTGDQAVILTGAPRVPGAPEGPAGPDSPWK